MVMGMKLGLGGGAAMVDVPDSWDSWEFVWAVDMGGGGGGGRGLGFRGVLGGS